MVKKIPNTLFLSKSRTPLLRYIVCPSLATTLVLLSVCPGFAQQERSVLRAPHDSPRARFSDLAARGESLALHGDRRWAGRARREAGRLTRQTNLARTVRLLRSSGRHPEVWERLGLDATLDPVANGGSALSSVQARMDDSRNGGLAWWVWALIGAGVATAAMQLEFGDDSVDNDDD